MKTTLRSCLFTAMMSICIQQVNAQCTVSDIIIQNVTAAGGQPPGSCTVKFDASFTLEHNSGNKYIFIHAWTQQDYPNYFDCVNGSPSSNGAIHAPEQADLANAFLNFGIDNSDGPTLLSEYTPDPAVTLSSVDSIRREIMGGDTAVFFLYGVTVTLPFTCGTPTVIMAKISPGVFCLA